MDEIILFFVKFLHEDAFWKKSVDIGILETMEMCHQSWKLSGIQAVNVHFYQSVLVLYIDEIFRTSIGDNPHTHLFWMRWW
jgi:hypothetical protein